jgi:indolepyruvate ferredoxin oxidoreductase beta subunit
VNVVFGGPGAARGSERLARAAFAAGHDVKQVELGSGLATVRYGAEVLSPLVPAGEGDYLVLFGADALDAARPLLRPGAVVIAPDAAGGAGSDDALLATLATHLDLPEEAWLAARRT